MNAEALAGCSSRNARGMHGTAVDNAAKDDAEEALKRRHREIVANYFVGATTTADALVLLSRRLTYAVKIPGISFHKGVESWLCTWKEPDSRWAWKAEFLTRGRFSALEYALLKYICGAHTRLHAILYHRIVFYIIFR